MICTKWPRLLVRGENVTEEQADEILIRTNSWWWLGGNDRDWSASVERVLAEFGYPVERDDATPEQRSQQGKDLETWRQRIGALDLEYLGNARIQSSWVGGPHGWCDWDGEIGCSTFNIGKWPSDNDVTTEWADIAAAFPYLTLTAQCINDEGEGTIAGEWRVHDGLVDHIEEPTEQLRIVREPVYTALVNPHWERGVSLDRLRKALETTTRSYIKEQSNG